MNSTKRRRFAALCLGMLAACTPVFAADDAIAPFTMPSARYGALGGTHAAYAKGLNALLINPAAFVTTPAIIGFAELSPSFFSNHSNPFGLIADIADGLSANSNEGTLKTLGPILKSLDNMALGVELGGPVSFGAIFNGIGFGVFNRAYAELRIAGQSLRVNANVDAFGIGGYALRVLDSGSHTLDAGITAKILYRYSVGTRVKLLDMLDSNSEVAITAAGVSAFGFGFDAGIQYRWAKDLSAALVWRDIVSPVFRTQNDNLLKSNTPEHALPVAFVHPNLDIGAAYTLSFIPLGELTLMLDYRDFTDLIIPQSNVMSRHPLLNIGFGAEYILWDMLFLRLGVTDALPAAGIGGKLGVFEIDLDIHGKELGLDPGVRPVWVVDLGLLFRL